MSKLRQKCFGTVAINKSTGGLLCVSARQGAPKFSKILKRLLPAHRVHSRKKVFKGGIFTGDIIFRCQTCGTFN